MNCDFIILSGGQGTRLKSVVGDQQKVFAKINNEPFLNILLKHIHSQGGRRIILSTGFKAQDLEDYYKKESLGLEILFSREDSPLGTGGAIKKACALVKTDDFFALNGDSFCALDYLAFLKFHQRHDALSSIAVTQVANNSDFGTISLDNQGQIISFQEKISSRSPKFVNAGIYCFAKEITKYMPAQDVFSIERDFFPTLVGKTFFGYPIKEKFLDIGTPERFEQAKKDL